ncbi:MAG: DUF421 domain-containing protein [Bacillota bacterium]
MPFWENQESLSVLQWILRGIVMFWWLLLMTKLMGQRQIGRLNVFDFIVAFTIGGTAAGVLNNSRNGLIGALTTIATLAALDIIVAFLALKNAKFRRIVQDEPLVLIQNGRIIENMLRKARFNLDDLLLELRLKNIPNLHDVEFAILESNGKLSIIPKSQSRAVKPSDLNISTKYEGMPTLLIEDGNIIEDNLNKSNLDKSWLINQLQLQGVNDPKTVFAAMLDTRGRLYISKKYEEFIR